ncbi:AcrR family transcriptional regulator [Saccharothrix tamanrassetensis]|uniref:AcrR family transcriptional regulator n=1 Tax=Saccharothrix tamanrassetensis TaxID=1051531 RepID=A0A841CS28_9PSEU|nr:TetR/AcrR family transcriptional regulator [Saccharothrix tamanrassetensis]MBB5958948.1 AcrR family transcriptional regulator [Saccharothrix tamanrassetensis]
MKVDGRVERGEQTRRQILLRAAEIASVEGLEGLSIGRLATELEVSKSGVFAHFGSKEELQLATIRAAAKIFATRVVEPASTAPPGLARLELLLAGWLEYSERRTFPGGCFFYAVQAEFDARHGRVRDTVAEYGRRWNDLVRTTIEDVPDLAVDPAQLAFELIAFLEMANVQSVLHDDPDAYTRARTAVRSALERATRRP